MEKTRIDDLDLDGLKIKQYINGYSFTSDSVLLANFISAKKSDVCVEVGAGSGVISILLNYKQQPKKIYAIEIQEKMSVLANENVILNNMRNTISVINADYNNVKQLLEDTKIDIVFSNPPYYKNGSCFFSENEEISISKHEKALMLSDLCEKTSKILKENGRFYVVYPATRTAELINELIKNKLQPKRMFFAQPTVNKNASVVFVEAVKNGKSGVIVLPTLITNTLDGDYIQTIQKLYRKEEK